MWVVHVLPFVQNQPGKGRGDKTGAPPIMATTFIALRSRVKYKTQWRRALRSVNVTMSSTDVRPSVAESKSKQGRSVGRREERGEPNIAPPVPRHDLFSHFLPSITRSTLVKPTAHYNQHDVALTYCTAQSPFQKRWPFDRTGRRETFLAISHLFFYRRTMTFIYLLLFASHVAVRRHSATQHTAHAAANSPRSTSVPGTV